MYQLINQWWPKKSRLQSDTISAVTGTAENLKHNFEPDMYPINDATLKVRILAGLHNNPNTTQALLSVTCHHGLVTLQGEVDTIDIRLAARIVVSRQKGVRGIIDKIKVVPLNQQPIMSLSQTQEPAIL